MLNEWLAWRWVIPATAAGVLLALALLAAVLHTPVYKHIICLKYLFCGWKAVVPMVSALPAALGVFLLILVFAIMDGFVAETREMTRGTLADIIVDAHMEGLPYYDDFVRRIENLEGVQAATPIIQTYAVIRVKPRYAGIRPIVRPCVVLGIRPSEKAEMGRFQEYLQRQRGSGYPAADLLKVPDYLAAPSQAPHPGCIAGVGVIGTPMPRAVAETVQAGAEWRVLLAFLTALAIVVFLFVWQASRRRPGRRLWRVAVLMWAEAVVALALEATLIPVTPTRVERTQVIDFPLVDYGGDIVVSTIPVRASGALDVEAGGIPKVSSRVLTLVDTFKSGYWEADSTNVYVHFAAAQQMAGMDGQPPSDGKPGAAARASQIQVKVKDPAQASAVVKQIDRAWQAFVSDRPEVGLLHLTVNTWETQQRMILTVVEVERNITALMLGMMFLGFGILIALISYVMAYIKSRDVGILKAVGARDAGVGSLFLGYGFIIGLIGTAIGLVGALLMLHYLDPIELWVNSSLGIDVFPREMYYFDHIPRHLSVPWCVGVSLAVLVLSTLASMAGGLLAALKQPVEALRYE
jgi:ABC-type lipoprotein release transport system permease subunit